MALKNNNQSGFTLMEVVVATAVFTFVVAAMLSLFTYTLQINRRVQSLRQVAQGTRNFTESFTREIRNGRIDYNSPDANCNPSNYLSPSNQSVAIVSNTGEKLCFYLQSGTLRVARTTTSTTTEVISPVGYTIVPETFRITVRPTTDPNPIPSCTPGTCIAFQPVVTIAGQFQVQVSGGQPQTIIPYQTSISTDVYDIPHN